MAKKPAAKSAAPQPQQAAQQQKPGTAVSTQVDAGALILVGDKHDLTHLSKGQARGNEGVGMEDLVIPRLEIVQGLSPAMKPSDPGYIEGAKQGDLVNSVTNKNYGREVFVVPVHYAKQWLLWKKMTEGGGFFGAFPDAEAAKEKMVEVVQGGEKEANLEVIDTPQHLCLIIDVSENKVEEIMLALAKTKAKVSRAWNTMIKLTQQDRFARVYKVTTALEKNKKGQEYYNFVVAQTGFAAKPLYARAEQLFQSISSGGRVINMDTKGYTPPDAGGDERADPEM